jgi:uncharacterized protein (DUF1330 family)
LVFLALGRAFVSIEHADDKHAIVVAAKIFGGDTMTTQIKILFAAMIGIVIGSVGFGALHAQTKTAAAYWVTETLEMHDQAAFMNAIKAVPPTLQAYGGHYIVLGGKIVPDTGPPPLRITIIAFDSLEKAQQWLSDPTALAARTEAQRYVKVREYTVQGVAN